MSQLVKKSLLQLLEYPVKTDSISGRELLINSIMRCFSFIVNLNTMHILQKDEKKLNEKEFFQTMIDMIFEKK